MDRAELFEAVSKDVGLSPARVRDVLLFAFYHIADRVTRGERVKLREFGEFHSVKRAARMIRNPRTGQIKMVPATTNPKFTPSLTFKATVAAKTGAKGMVRPLLSIER